MSDATKGFILFAGMLAVVVFGLIWIVRQRLRARGAGGHGRQRRLGSRPGTWNPGSG